MAGVRAVGPKEAQGGEAARKVIRERAQGTIPEREAPGVQEGAERGREPAVRGRKGARQEAAVAPKQGSAKTAISPVRPNGAGLREGGRAIWTTTIQIWLPRGLSASPKGRQTSGVTTTLHLVGHPRGSVIFQLRVISNAPPPGRLVGEENARLGNANLLHLAPTISLIRPLCFGDW